MKGLITICGRGGSKGLSSKNIKLFLDYPLITYTISAADLFKKQCHGKTSFDIAVNSDSDSLLKISEKTGVCHQIKRPAELARDNSSKISAIKHSISIMENTLGKKYDFVIDLDITSPLRKLSDIDNALSHLIQQKSKDVVFSVVPSRRNPFFNMVIQKHEKICRVIDTQFITRQEAPLVFDMNASIYVYRRDSLDNKITRSVFDGDADIVIMEDTGVIDIDTLHDFEMMEIIADYFYNKYSEYCEIKENISNIY